MYEYLYSPFSSQSDIFIKVCGNKYGFELVPFKLRFLEEGIRRKYIQELSILTMVLSNEIVMNCECFNNQIQFFLQKRSLIKRQEEKTRSQFIVYK